MRKPILNWITRVAILDATIAILVPIFQGLFGSRTSFHELIWQYLYAILYSNLIGIPINLVFPATWRRTSGWPLLWRSGARIGMVFFANFTGCLLAGIVLRSVIGPKYEYWPEFRVALGISLVLSAIAVSFLSMYATQQSKLKRSAMELKTKEVERERALKLATEARLSSLEARIHPHFLFNTINSISSLIHEDPLRAERLLTQFAGLLRFSLDSAPGSLVLLARELQIVENYLEIERARFGERLRYRMEVSPDLLELRVPPLSLQTLVENSVKYAVGPRSRGANLIVEATADNERLRLSVIDDGPGFSSLELPAGHGLSNLEERLRALFGDSAKLSVASDAAQTVVALEMPCAQAGLAGVSDSGLQLQAQK